MAAVFMMVSPKGGANLSRGECLRKSEWSGSTPDAVGGRPIAPAMENPQVDRAIAMVAATVPGSAPS
ncbi:hypothetical protein ACFQE0_17540 [Methylobacterium komagatae]|uniref:Uncharacterized protein n=1 Tax=Methylobacterium komagatae TaxID=374425 RepID=A0ABW2BLB0_9HYPH